MSTAEFFFLEGVVIFSILLVSTILFPVASAIGDRCARYIRNYR